MHFDLNHKSKREFETHLGFSITVGNHARFLENLDMSLHLYDLG